MFVLLLFFAVTLVFSKQQLQIASVSKRK